ncbi:hypothetical protein ZYGR_0BB00690 [Zygosaccharomyces rouxii]|uniref:Cell wall protein CWP1 n=1 Tax=Zygosaccharomyces rouxii TaxID=4956 RepID=A0A1Q3AL56_ZYGRO|nr:hypothetical protein ZYGR_0BB00690 [Zygosaccharomyces rouxii]
MQFTTLALAALASAQAAFAASGSQEFSPLSIASGSGLQYASIVAKGDDLYFGAGSDALSANVTDCGFLQFKDGSYAYVESDGSFKKGSRQDAMPGFVIKDGSLEYNNQGFFGVKDGEQYRLSSESRSDDSIGVLIRALALDGGATPVPDYSPDGKDCWALGPPVYVSKRDVATVSSGNGAAQLGSQASLGVGAAAAVAAILL